MAPPRRGAVRFLILRSSKSVVLRTVPSTRSPATTRRPGWCCDPPTTAPTRGPRHPAYLSEPADGLKVDRSSAVRQSFPRTLGIDRGDVLNAATFLLLGGLRACHALLRRSADWPTGRSLSLRQRGCPDVPGSCEAVRARGDRRAVVDPWSSHGAGNAPTASSQAHAHAAHAADAYQVRGAAER